MISTQRNITTLSATVAAQLLYLCGMYSWNPFLALLWQWRWQSHVYYLVNTLA